MSHSDSPLVKYEAIGPVALITLNDPARLNVISHGPESMAEGLLAAMDRAEADDSIRCLVLTGEGRAFSAGGDLGGLKLESALDFYRFLEANVRETDRIRGGTKPTIGAINGLCYGFGLIIATHLDMIIASDQARFGLLETRFGSSGAQTLVYHVGPQWAKFLALSGELITAEKAQQIGLVMEVFPHETMMDKALDLARRVAAMPREAAALNRQVINGALNLMGWEQQRELALALNTVTNQMSSRARSHDGQVLSEVLAKEGWAAYKSARDSAFEPPWLAQ